MKILLIGAVSLGLWLAALPAGAQTANLPKNTQAPPRVAAPPSPVPQRPAASPEELSHQAMVEEQKRRDREAEAERERDDL
jgi:hypothetical protein